jgi:hypothetical protein
MQDEEMKLAFLTRFSESCFDAIPAVAQWVDDVASSLTIIHVYDQRRTHRSDAQAQLNAFYAEADRYRTTRRVLLEGADVAGAVASYLEAQPHDLLLCPASDRVGFPRPWHKSTRAALLQTCDTPLWTVGARLDVRISPRIQRVGCLLSPHADCRSTLLAAERYALFHGAVLQLMAVAHEPDVESLRRTLQQGIASAAEDRRLGVRVLTQSWESYMSTHDDARSIRNMLSGARTDILFASKPMVVRQRFARVTVADFLDAAGCPVICVDEARQPPVWQLTTSDSAVVEVGSRFARS